ncbi:flagellar hook assembly protein FlgD [Litorisediminicola beolgyonensis]|uniref:Basal-body rod modification protein FlgD n=1 Tax=Litorisediminicola beolgyonensis TaxID=1173614 RepID=A0ABW3ZG78_9RHOB
MTIDPLAPTGAALQTKADAARQSLSADYESFLKLLTAQVANQDPLKPMDSTTFVSQLAQLSQVEQSIQTNDTLERISTALSSFGSMADVGLIGRSVSVPSSEVKLGTDGAEMAFRLDRPAAKVEAQVLGTDGTVLRRFTGLSGEAGTRHDIHWNGLDREGLAVPPGTYRIAVVATDAAGDRVGYTSFSEAKVDSLVFRDGAAYLRLGSGEEIASSEVMAVR